MQDDALKNEIVSLLTLRRHYQQYIDGDIDFIILTNAIVVHCKVYGGDPLELVLKL